MFQRSLILTMSLLLITFAFHTVADAQIEKVTFHVDAFLCGNVCTTQIQSVMKAYGKDIEDLDIDYKNGQVTIFPKPKKVLDLYELRRELRNAEHAPWKIEITVTGEVTDYTKVYSGGHTHPRKALKVKETGQQFILKEGKQLDKLLEAGHEKVTISGEVPALLEKGLALLVIKAFKEAKEQKKTDKAGK